MISFCMFCPKHRYLFVLLFFFFFSSFLADYYSNKTILVYCPTEYTKNRKKIEEISICIVLTSDIGPILLLFGFSVLFFYIPDKDGFDVSTRMYYITFTSDL